ncbi:MAG TPA: MFS transporter [Caulobacteraceae bacterium]|jgi:MFS family permease
MAELLDQAGGTKAPATTSGPTTYYVLLLAQAVSLLGSQISGLAVSIAVFRQTGHATPLALVAAFQVVPRIVLSGLAGALADRFDRRQIMLAANIGYVATSGLLLASFASGAFQLWHLYVLVLGSAVCAALEAPAAQASVAMLVPDAGRDRANAIGMLSGPAAGVLAPTLAGLLYAFIGVVGAISVDLATFVVAIVTLVLIRIPMPPQSAEGRQLRAPIWRQAFDGFRYLRARPTLLGLCGSFAIFNVFVLGAVVLVVPYILDRTGNVAALGVVMGTLNFGALVGAVVMAVWGGTRPRIHTVMLGAAMVAVSLALAGVSRGALSIGASLFMLMFATPFIEAAMMSILQAKTAPDLQGRVFASIGQITAVLRPAAYVISGPLADRVFEPARRLPLWRTVAWLVGQGTGAGIGLMFVAGGALALLLALTVYGLPAIRRLEATLPDHAAEPA